MLDPGYGFGKRFEENYSLLARQAELLALGRPLLAGVSRKSFLGRALAPLHGGSDAPVEARETASVAALAAAILHGASIVRVHAVRPAVEAARIADAVLAGVDSGRPGMNYDGLFRICLIRIGIVRGRGSEIRPESSGVNIPPEPQDVEKQIWLRCAPLRMTAARMGHPRSRSNESCVRRVHVESTRGATAARAVLIGRLVGICIYVWAFFLPAVREVATPGGDAPMMLKRLALRMGHADQYFEPGDVALEGLSGCIQRLDQSAAGALPDLSAVSHLSLAAPHRGWSHRALPDRNLGLLYAISAGSAGRPLSVGRRNSADSGWGGLWAEEGGLGGWLRAGRRACGGLLCTDTGVECAQTIDSKLRGGGDKSRLASF